MKTIPVSELQIGQSIKLNYYSEPTIGRVVSVEPFLGKLKLTIEIEGCQEQIHASPDAPVDVVD